MTGRMVWTKSVEIKPAKLKLVGRSVTMRKGTASGSKTLTVAPAKVQIVGSDVDGELTKFFAGAKIIVTTTPIVSAH